jgi:hypothetical protein
MGLLWNHESRSQRLAELQAESGELKELRYGGMFVRWVCCWARCCASKPATVRVDVH